MKLADFRKIAEAVGYSVSTDMDSDDKYHVLDNTSCIIFHGDSYECDQKMKVLGEEFLNPPQTAQAGMAWTEIAASAYRSYAASTGNKNYQGLPMPAFDELPLPIQTAWEAAVRQAGWLIFGGGRPSDSDLMQSEQHWNVWVRP